MSDKANTPDQSEAAPADTVQASATSQEAKDDLPDEGGSLASKVLTGLVLLVAGGFLAIWGGPQIAPHLPAGLAPVAEFLAPQSESETDLRLTALEDSQRAFENRVTARLDSIERTDEEFASDIADLAANARLGGSSSASSADLARLDAAIDDLRDRVAQLAVRLETAGADGTAEFNSELLQAENAIAALRAELSRVTENQTNLERELATARGELEAQMRLATSEMATVTQAAEVQVGSAKNRQLFVELERALNSGAPFSALVNNTELELPSALAVAATSGVVPMEELKAQFPDLAYDAIRADISASADDGVLGRLSAFLQKQVAVRSLEPLEGDGTDAILSRIDSALARDDLDTVLAEAENLSFAPAAALEEWIAAVRLRHNAFEALAEFAADG